MTALASRQSPSPTDCSRNVNLDGHSCHDTVNVAGFDNEDNVASLACLGTFS